MFDFCIQSLYPDATVDEADFSSIQSAVDAIARGEFVVVVDDENRENEGDLIIAAGGSHAGRARIHGALYKRSYLRRASQECAGSPRSASHGYGKLRVASDGVYGERRLPLWNVNGHFGGRSCSYHSRIVE